MQMWLGQHIAAQALYLHQDTIKLNFATAALWLHVDAIKQGILYESYVYDNLVVTSNPNKMMYYIYVMMLDKICL